MEMPFTQLESHYPLKVLNLQLQLKKRKKIKHIVEKLLFLRYR